MILLLAIKTCLLFALRAMFYSKCENEHKHITKSSRLMRKMPGKTIWHCVICSWFQHADQGTLEPKSLRTEGQSQTTKPTEGRGPASDGYRALDIGSTDKEPSILFYEDREATSCLKEILAHFLKHSSKKKKKNPMEQPKLQTS